MNKGSSHDSSAFGNTKLFDLLKEQADNLRKEGLFLVSDSAYPIYSFLLVPYDQHKVENDPVGPRMDATTIYPQIAYISSALLVSLICDGGSFGVPFAST